jgi:hypothetical protein
MNSDTIEAEVSINKDFRITLLSQMKNIIDQTVYSHILLKQDLYAMD